MGVHFSRIRVSNLMLVDHEGRIVQEPKGVRPILNQAAFAIHSRLHLARPDVNAAAHSHSLYGKAFSALGKLLNPISQGAAAFYQDRHRPQGDLRQPALYAADPKADRHREPADPGVSPDPDPRAGIPASRRRGTGHDRDVGQRTDPALPGLRPRLSARHAPPHDVLKALQSPFLASSGWMKA
jgi:hypothetical protein